MRLSVQNLSFKAIILKGKTKVQNKQTGKFETVSFCEVDCKDKKDSEIFYNLKDTWEYAQALETSAQWKFGNQQKGYDDPRMHYILQKRNGEILAICRAYEEYGATRIDYLEANPNEKYRFAGQMILANIAKETIKKDGDRMLVPNPEIGTHDFYGGACGFKRLDYGYIMENQDLIDFSACIPKQK